MNGTVNIGLVDTDELTRVFDSIWMLRTEGKNTPGVVVFCEDGRRKWWITSDKLTILITGDTAEFTGAYRLPLTIIANAGRQSAANGAVTYTIHGDVITADSARGKQTVSCTSVPTPKCDRVAITRSRASARLSGKDLAWVVFSGANVPFESMMFDDDEDRQAPDHFTIGIEKNLITVASDWTRAKMYKMTGSTAAITKGSGQIRLDPDLLSVLFNCVDADSEWTVSFDPLEPHSIVLESDSQYIVSKMTKVPAAEMQERVRRLLENEKFEHQTAVDGRIGVRVNGVVVSIEIFERSDDQVPLLGMSTIIVRNANESAELLREINAHNRAGSVSRLWLENDKVLLGIEVLPDNVGVLPARLRQLSDEATRLTGVLEPFAAEAALPARKRKRRKKPTDQQPEVWY
ncbi:MAG: hypothetical protein ACKOXX_05285 [Actinomycetota bacterium]|jgi:hypothetical protein